MQSDFRTISWPRVSLLTLLAVGDGNLSLAAKKSALRRDDTHGCNVYALPVTGAVWK